MSELFLPVFWKTLKNKVWLRRDWFELFIKRKTLRLTVGIQQIYFRISACGRRRVRREKKWKTWRLRCIKRAEIWVASGCQMLVNAGSWNCLSDWKKDLTGIFEILRRLHCMNGIKEPFGLCSFCSYFCCWMSSVWMFLLKDVRQCLPMLFWKKTILKLKPSKSEKTLNAYEKRSIVQQMSGMIAHELSSPLGSIRTYVTLLKMEGSSKIPFSKEVKQKALNGIEEQVLTMSKSHWPCEGVR